MAGVKFNISWGYKWNEKLKVRIHKTVFSSILALGSFVLLRILLWIVYQRLNLIDSSYLLVIKLSLLLLPKNVSTCSYIVFTFNKYLFRISALAKVESGQYRYIPLPFHGLPYSNSFNSRGVVLFYSVFWVLHFLLCQLRIETLFDIVMTNYY